MIKRVHGSGWVGLRRFFDITHHGGLKKIQLNHHGGLKKIQPNPNHMGWVEPMGWTKLLLLNWVKKYKYIKKNPKISINVTP